MPQISVIVPVYKVEQYLPACVDSILAQTYRDFELILVDDGSPDNCGSMCDAYAAQDPRIRVIHRLNGGLSAARNSGIDAASGDYLCFIDSDDLVSPDYLELLEIAVETCSAQIAVGRLLPFPDGASVSLKTQSKNASVKQFTGPKAALAQYSGSKEITVNACGKLFQSSLFGTQRFPEGRVHEDQALVPILLYQATKVAVHAAARYHYRDRADSITTIRFSAKRYDDLWAIDYCISFFDARQEAEILEAARLKRKKLMSLYALYARKSGVPVPQHYRVSVWRALSYLWKHVPPYKFDYYLSQTYPKLVVLAARLRKLLSIFRKNRRGS